MKILNLILLTVLTFLFSCNRNKGNYDMYAESESIYREAMVVHDEIMPRMGEIMDLQAKLKSKKEVLQDKEDIDKINIALQNLEDAHNEMMHWMRNITKIPDKDEIDSNFTSLTDPDEMLKIQKQSLKQIQQVKTNISASIKEAQKLIEELP